MKLRCWIVLRRAVAVAACLSLAGAASAAEIAHYNMSQAGSPIIDLVGGQQAVAVGVGHNYGVAGPAGFGSAVSLTGNGAWQLSVADSAELRSLANNMSVAAWVYMDSATLGTKAGVNSVLNRIIGDDAAWDGDGWSFGVWGDGRMRFTKNGVVDQDVPAGVPLDQWVHVAATVSSSVGTTFYVNGAVAGTNGNTANMNTGLGNNGVDDPYAIGRSYGAAEAQWFAGRMDEVRVFDTVLSQGEVQAMMVPEPSSVALLACAGMMGGALIVRRRRR